MKLKKIKINRVMAIGILMVALSCSDEFTNLEPIGNSSVESFWQTEDDAIEAVNSMYFYMKDEDMFSRGFFWYINASDDMITGRTNASADNIANFITTGTESYSRWMYPQSYKIIKRANDVLTNVPEMDINEDLKNRLLGEAYFMRGFHYFWLAHTYGDNGGNGGVPIVIEENMNNPAGSYTRPESVIENYEQIVSDLTLAVELLPLYTEYGSEDLGRAHKDAALAYIAKTYLYWAQYDTSKWADVITYCDTVTNSGSGRALINTDSPETDFRELHSYLNNWTSEYIWSVNSGTDGGSILPGVALENKGWGLYNGWGYFQPTLELYNEFEEDDVRREITILKFGDEFKFLGKERAYYSENSLSGFQFNKYMYEYQFEDAIGSNINTNGDSPTTRYNIPILRYAEILLMKSEAQIMQGLNGDDALNTVRERAGLVPILGATLEDLKHERRVEFAGEFANRHFDLIRWGDAIETYTQPLHGRIHSSKTDPNSDFTIEIVREARNFDPLYMHVWPIPVEVIDASGIPQNKGW